MIWIVIALIFAAAAAAGFRIQALTRDEPPEPPLAHRWRAMGGSLQAPDAGPHRVSGTAGSRRPGGTAPSGPSLTGKQTGLGWYGPVFTPSRRPPQGHLD